MKTKDESIVLNALVARRENYNVSSISHNTGRYYEVVMNGERHNAVVLFSSFEYYERRYHLAEIQPTLCICMIHNTVLPVACLALRMSNFAEPYEIPEIIKDIASQRHGKTGCRVLLGQYILGVHNAIDFVEDLPDTTRKRYQRKAKALAQRDRGRPVGLAPKEKEEAS